MECCGIMCDCAILLPFFKTTSKKVYEHLEKLNFTIGLNNYLYKLFVSLFMQGIHKEIWLCVWDLIFLEGHIVLFKAALTIIHLAEKSILHAKNMIEINEFFEEGLENFTHENFLKELIQTSFTFDDEYITAKRNENLPKAIDNIKHSNEFKIKLYKQKEDQLECNVDWPICVSRLTNFKIDRCFVFRRLDEVCIVEDFYDINDNVRGKIIKKKKENKKGITTIGNEASEDVKMEIYREILIERAVHKCKYAKVNKEENKNYNLIRVSGKDKLERQSDEIDEMRESINIINSYIENKRSINPSKIINEIEKSNLDINEEDNIIRESISVFEKPSKIEHEEAITEEEEIKSELKEKEKNNSDLNLNKNNTNTLNLNEDNNSSLKEKRDNKNTLKENEDNKKTLNLNQNN